MKRGRKSAAALGIVVTLPGQRPEPPIELTETQAQVWRSVVATKPADWFGADTQPMLIAYCRRISSLDDIASLVNGFDRSLLNTDDGLARYERLLRLREREDRATTALARSMRLTQQSRLKAETAATKAGSITPRRPWEIGSA